METGAAGLGSTVAAGVELEVEYAHGKLSFESARSQVFLHGRVIVLLGLGQAHRDDVATSVETGLRFLNPSISQHGQTSQSFSQHKHRHAVQPIFLREQPFTRHLLHSR
jgi:hypothetical protein